MTFERTKAVALLLLGSAIGTAAVLAWVAFAMWLAPGLIVRTFLVFGPLLVIPLIVALYLDWRDQ